MLTNELINEAEWVAYLQENLNTSDVTLPSSSVQLETDQGGKFEAVDQISVLASKPISEVVIQPIPGNLPIQDQFRGGVIDRAIITELSAVNLSKSQLAIKAKPEWTISSRQIYRQVPPIPMLSEPLQVGNFLLWPDPQEDSLELSLPDKFATQLDDRYVKPLPPPIFIDQRDKIVPRPDVLKPVIRQNLAPIARVDSVVVDQALLDKTRLLEAMDLKIARVKVRRAFFTTIMPELQSFRLTIRQGQTAAITGGTALLTVSLYAQQSEVILEKNRLVWTDALAKAGYGSRLWKFLPVNLRNVQAFLDIDSQQLNAPVQVAINPNAGTATFLLELSAIGAQLWKRAIENRQIYQITGVARFTAKFYARTNEKLQIREQVFNANLATLLSTCGPEHIEILPPTLSLSTSVIVLSHAFVESVAVTWQPKQGGETIRQNFAGNQGGTVMGVVLTDNLNTVEIDWNAQVKYRLPSWSSGLQQGKLTLANPTEIVKPGSSEWILEYTIYTVLMATSTQVASNISEFDDIEIEATLTFIAPYLTLPLSTTFNPRHLDVTDVPFPLIPGQNPKQVGIMVVTKSKSRNTILDSVQRILQPEELLLNLKIFHNGQVEVRSSADRIGESSIDQELFELLAHFRHRSEIRG